MKSLTISARFLQACGLPIGQEDRIGQDRLTREKESNSLLIFPLASQSQLEVRYRTASVKLNQSFFSPLQHPNHCKQQPYQFEAAAATNLKGLILSIVMVRTQGRSIIKAIMTPIINFRKFCSLRSSIYYSFLIKLIVQIWKSCTYNQLVRYASLPSAICPNSFQFSAVSGFRKPKKEIMLEKGTTCLQI